jgi:hypothetical protein
MSSGFMVATGKHGEHNSEDKHRYAYAKKDKDPFPGLRPVQIIFFRNYDLMSHCYIVIRLSVVIRFVTSEAFLHTWQFSTDLPQ